MSSRDLKRYEALRRLGCIACHIDGRLEVPADVHHLVDKGYRKHSGGNQATIPLCEYHHRGVTSLPLWEAAGRFGPSLALASKAFHEKYGTDRDLLAIVNELIRH